MGGGAETMYTQLLSYLVRENNMETYYPWTWLSFINQKNEKNKKLKFVNETYISTVPKVLFFKTTDLNIAYLFSEDADN